MIPQHVAIIMDGNGRWAKARGYPRFYGHVRGASRVREVVTLCREQGVKALTLYAFSTENWKRPEDELSVLWKLLKKYIRREVKTLKENGIRLAVIGQPERLPLDAQKELSSAIDFLRDGQDMCLTFALSYGGRSEILNAAVSWAQASLEIKGSVSAPTEAEFSQHLSTHYLGAFSDVDLMIRTSGEKRISNYLLWQCSYAEFDFPEIAWPDFTKQEMKKALDRFKNRERRFGAIP